MSNILGHPKVKLRPLYSQVLLLLPVDQSKVYRREIRCHYLFDEVAILLWEKLFNHDLMDFTCLHQSLILSLHFFSSYFLKFSRLILVSLYLNESCIPFQTIVLRTVFPIPVRFRIRLRSTIIGRFLRGLGKIKFEST